MIIPGLSIAGEAAWIFTIVEVNGKYVKVGVTEEELFRVVLGDKEFEYRRNAAYANEHGGPPPPPPDPPKPLQVEEAKPRHINLKDMFEAGETKGYI